MPRNSTKLADRLSDRLEAVVEAISIAAVDHPQIVPLLKRRVGRAANALALIVRDREPA